SRGAARWAVEIEPGRSARGGVGEPLRTRLRAEEEENGRERQLFAALEGDGLELPILSVECGDLAAVADSDAEAVQLVDEVGGHRLGKIGPAVEQGHERTAAREPDR